MARATAVNKHTVQEFFTKPRNCHRQKQFSSRQNL